MPKRVSPSALFTTATTLAIFSTHRIVVGDDVIPDVGQLLQPFEAAHHARSRVCRRPRARRGVAICPRAVRDAAVNDARLAGRRDTHIRWPCVCDSFSYSQRHGALPRRDIVGNRSVGGRGTGTYDSLQWGALLRAVLEELSGWVIFLLPSSTVNLHLNQPIKCLVLFYRVKRPFHYRLSFVRFSSMPFLINSIKRIVFVMLLKISTLSE